MYIANNDTTPVEDDEMWREINKAHKYDGNDEH